MLRTLASSSRTAPAWAVRPPTLPRTSAWAAHTAASSSRSRHTYIRRVSRRQNELTRAKMQAEAVSGELPSTPVGPAIGFGGSGGGGGNGVRDAVLTTVVGVVICEYRSLYDIGTTV